MPDALKCLRAARGQESIACKPRLIMGQAAPGQYGVDILGALLGAGHQADIVTSTYEITPVSSG